MRIERQKSSSSSAERLRRLDPRRDDVAGAVAQLELAEALGFGEVDAGVEDAHRLGARVVVDDHLLGADDAVRRSLLGASHESSTCAIVPSELEVDERDVGRVRA